MRKISTKLSLVIIACVFTAMAALGTISITKSHKIVRADAEEMLL